MGNVVQIFSRNELSYMFVGTDTDHPLPYTRYRFLLQAENSVAGVNSSFTDTIETTTSSMCRCFYFYFIDTYFYCIVCLY